MPRFDLLPSFNAGEVSPFIDSRTDLNKYRSACRVLENMIPMPYGGVNRRPGIEFISEIYTEQILMEQSEMIAITSGDDLFAGIFNLFRLSAGETVTISGLTIGNGTYVLHELTTPLYAVLADPLTGDAILWSAISGTTIDVLLRAGERSRLFHWNYSTTTRYQVEIGHHYIRIFSATTNPEVVGYIFGFNPVTNSPVVPTVPVPWADFQLDDIQFLQLNDIAYIVHPLHPTMKLIRYADTSWELEQVYFDFPPLLSENDTGVTLTCSGTTGIITVTASATLARPRKPGQMSFWTEKDSGSRWAIYHKREINSVSLSISTTGTSLTSIQVVGTWEISTSGTWFGDLFLERSLDSGSTWEVIRNWNSNGDRNFNTTGVQTFPAIYRVRFTASIGTPAGTPRALLQVSDSTHIGVIEITDIQNSLVAHAHVIQPLYSTAATKRWAEPAFSDLQGWASCVCLHEQRLFLAGSTSRVQTVWGSQLDDYENFRVGTLESDGINVTLAAGQQNRIEWMLSQGALIIGTAGDEWTLEGSDTTRTLSPTNLRALNQSRYGSANIRAMLLADVVLFIQRNSRKVRELTYSLERDNWVGVDLTLLAEHVTQSGISEIAYQQQPDANLWCIRGDGQLAGMVYERDQNVVGWHRHTTDGDFESVSVVHGNGTEDEVWFVVRRTINGASRRYIERFALNWRTFLDDADSQNWWYMDCANRFANDPASTEVSGLDHLEGKVVTIYTDAGAVETKTVSSGSITLSTAATGGIVGLPFTSTIKPMRLNSDFENGTSQSRKARIHRAVARVYKSRGGQVRTNGGTWRTIIEPGVTETGDKKVSLSGAFDDTADIEIRAVDPFPFTLIALIPVWDAYGNE